MADSRSFEVTVDQEVSDTSMGKPHVLLLGAGTSKAALPKGDKYGNQVPLLRDVAQDLNLVDQFPESLQELARQDFEAAYSRLTVSMASTAKVIEDQVSHYFSGLQLPDTANLYDAINLSLREKDVILTFNWDPFLLQSRIRLAKLGVGRHLPQLFFLHGNVLAGFCRQHRTSGLVGRRCSQCHELFEPSRLLFPVERKDYQDGGLIEREWEAARYYLKNCFMFTIFGYSAPKTDIEAVELLKDGWGDPQSRDMEQTEIISRPGADEEQLRETWKPFIHTHHYEIHDSFYESWLGNHPRRSGEAYWNQYWEAKFVSDNPIPRDFGDLRSLVDWFKPLIEVERAKAGGLQAL